MPDSRATARMMTNRNSSTQSECSSVMVGGRTMSEFVIEELMVAVFTSSTTLGSRLDEKADTIILPGIRESRVPITPVRDN